MFPHRFDFIVGERKAACFWNGIRSQKFGKAPVYYIQFQGRTGQGGPHRLLDGRLGAIPFPTTNQWFLAFGKIAVVYKACSHTLNNA